MRSKVQRAVVGIVLIHVLVTILHGLAHGAIDVSATPEQSMFIGVVIILAPLVAVLCQLVGRSRLGAWMFLLSMMGAAVFGIINHMIIPGPDNVSQAPYTTWGSVFSWSALALAAIEGAGIVVGALAVLESRRKQPAPSDTGRETKSFSRA